MRALISVSNKDGIEDFVLELINLGYEIVSTGGTYKRLKSLNIDLIEKEMVEIFSKDFLEIRIIPITLIESVETGPARVTRKEASSSLFANL